MAANMAAVHVAVSSWRAPSFHRLSPQSGLSSAAFRQRLPTIRRSSPLRAGRPVYRCAVASSGKYIRENYLVKKVSAKEVYDLVQGKRNVPLVIDFYATWCGPCILMAQDLEMLAVEYENNVMIVKVDTDEEYQFARDMQVRGLPTLFFVSPDPSKDAIRTEGLIPIEMMRKIIETEM